VVRRTEKLAAKCSSDRSCPNLLPRAMSVNGRQRNGRFWWILLKKSARDIFVHGSAGVIHLRHALWINRFQPQYLKYGSFAAFNATDFFNTIGRKRSFRLSRKRSNSEKSEAFPKPDA